MNVGGDTDTDDGVDAGAADDVDGDMTCGDGANDHLD